jgi:soluble cytochrome b562
MEPEQLSKYIKEASSPRVKSMAEQVLREKTGKASGGIMRFYAGEKVQDKTLYKDAAEALQATTPKTDVASDTKINPDDAVRQAYIDAAKLNAKNSQPYTLSDAEKTQETNYFNAPPVKLDTREVDNLRNVRLPTGNAPTTEPNPNSSNFIPPNLRAPNASNQAGITAARPDAPIPPARVNEIVNQNPQLKNAMGDNTPDKNAAQTMGIYKDLLKELKVEDLKPTDEYAGMTTEAIANKLETDRSKFLGPNPSGKQRESIMAERANAQDEAKRTQAMRMAEFFAMWGSTPGNTIVAGLNAIKNKIPDFIADKKDATKIRRDIDKSIAELDRVDYLEKAGRWDEAEKKRAKATETALNTWGIYTTKALSLANTVTKEIGDTERNTATIAGRSKDAETQARGQITAAGIRASNNDINDLSKVQARITGLMDQERKLRVGPLKTDLKFIEHEAAILKNDPKRIDDINKAKLRVKEQLDPIKAEIEQLNRVKMNLGAIQNLPGQASGSSASPVIQFNEKGERVK